MKRLLLLVVGAASAAFGAAQDYVREPIPASWSGPRRTVALDLGAFFQGVAEISGEVFVLPELALRASGGVWTGGPTSPRWVQGPVAQGGAGSVGIRCYPSGGASVWGRAFVGLELARERYAVRENDLSTAWTRTDAQIELGWSRTWWNHLTLQAHVASGPGWVRSTRRSADAVTAADGPGRIAGLQVGWSW
jgi:hypothetical protein